MRWPVLIALVGALLWPGGARAFDPFAAARIDRRPSAVLPLTATFKDEQDRSVTLGGLMAGKPALLIPLLHNCPNICGVTLAGVMEAILAQPYRPGPDFQVVAMSIDPRETPDDARRSMAELARRYPRLAPAVHALTGRQAEIGAVTDALGYRYQWDAGIEQYAHIAATAAITPDGRLSRWLYGLQPEADDLKLALTEAGKGRIGTWADQLLLLCYHYDPTTGKYSSRIWAALRLGGAATAAALAAWLAFSFWRERRAAGGPYA